jgi:transcriptional regulator
MYLPSHFREDRIEVLAAFMDEVRFATLVSRIAGELVATHLPLLWDPEPAPFGTLSGHFARGNPHGAAGAAGAESLAVFLGPGAYVSPSWYPSKRVHGRVVPTWNYVAVHAAGSLELVDDLDWLRAFVTRLTDAQEGGLPEPWKVTDAPEAYVAGMLRGIVGVRMPVGRLEGKWKLGQNRPEADVEGTIAGLRGRADAASAAVAGAMAARRRDPAR